MDNPTNQPPEGTATEIHTVPLSPEMQALQDKAERCLSRAHKLALATLDDPEKVAFLKKRLVEITDHVNNDPAYDDPADTKLYDARKVDLQDPVYVWESAISKYVPQPLAETIPEKAKIERFKERSFTILQDKDSERGAILYNEISIAPGVIEERDEKSLTLTCLHEMGHKLLSQIDLSYFGSRPSHIVEHFCDAFGDVAFAEHNFEKEWGADYKQTLQNTKHYTQFFKYALKNLVFIDENEEKAIQDLEENIAALLEDEEELASLSRQVSDTHSQTHPSMLSRMAMSAQTVQQLAEPRYEDYLSELYGCTMQFPWNKKPDDPAPAPEELPQENYAMTVGEQKMSFAGRLLKDYVVDPAAKWFKDISAQADSISDDFDIRQKFFGNKVTMDVAKAGVLPMMAWGAVDAGLPGAVALGIATGGAYLFGAYHNHQLKKKAPQT